MKLCFEGDFKGAARLTPWETSRGKKRMQKGFLKKAQRVSFDIGELIERSFEGRGTQTMLCM